MTPSKDEIKAWLKRSGHSREWLGEQCGKTKNTVNNWLSTNIEIPESTLHLIARLMEDDARADAERKKSESSAPLSHLVIQVEVEEFNAWEKIAIHQTPPQTVTDWALQAIKDACLADTASKIEPVSLHQPSNLIAFELPFFGAVAAGEPVSATLEETVTVPREYPPGHFVVQINGRSGEPQFMDGERWVIDGRDCFTPKKGKPCVVSDGYGSYLKKWNPKRQAFESINPAFNDVIPLADAKLQGYPVEKLG